MKTFTRTLAILHLFAPCEIMHLTSEFIDIKKEFWLLQASAVTGFFKHSHDAEKKNTSFFLLMCRPKNFASALFPFSLCNSNFFGFLSMKILSNISATLIVKYKTNYLYSTGDYTAINRIIEAALS